MLNLAREGFSRNVRGRMAAVRPLDLMFLEGKLFKNVVDLKNTIESTRHRTATANIVLSTRGLSATVADVYVLFLAKVYPQSCRVTRIYLQDTCFTKLRMGGTRFYLSFFGECRRVGVSFLTVGRGHVAGRRKFGSAVGGWRIFVNVASEMSSPKAGDEEDGVCH